MPCAETDCKEMTEQENYAYEIEGGYPVIGEIRCLGAKNFVIKAMVAALLGNTDRKSVV